MQNKRYILLAIILAASILTIIFTTMVANAWDNPNFYGQPIEFQATAYCETGNPTKSGVYPLVGRTIAVDPKIIPLGSTVIVYNKDMELIGIFQAEDTGKAIKGQIIDIYMKSESECWEWGRQKVYLQIIQAEG